MWAFQDGFEHDGVHRQLNGRKHMNVGPGRYSMDRDRRRVGDQIALTRRIESQGRFGRLGRKTWVL